MTKSLLIVTLIFVGLSSCRKDEKNSKSGSEFITILKNIPETVNLGNNIINLHVNLSRDFMPICEEDGRPLYCTVGLDNSQHLDLQEKIELKKIHVIYNGELWSKTLSKLYFGPGDMVRGFAENGPKWGPNVIVDVVCEFEYKGILRRISSKNQNIILVE
nr:hypothetical protein [uncultured Fluviicola sp.]